MTKIVKAFIRNEQGATAIEYGMIAAAISVAILAVLFLIGGDVAAQFEALLDYI